MADGVASDLKALAPSAPGFTVGASLPGEMIGSAALRIIADLQEEANSPDMVKAGLARQKLADWDAFAVAQRSNDLEAERKVIEARSQ